MAKRTEAYVDTSALIAFLDGSDSYHSLFRLLFSEAPPLITSALVIAEGHGWFLRRYDQRRAIQFLNFASELPMTVEPFDSDAVAAAGAVVKRFQDQRLTLPDAHGLAMLKERRIPVCWSTDRHLSLTGARLVVDGG